MAYQNQARIEQDEKELEELEAAYRKQFSGEQIEAEEEAPNEPELTPEEETWKERYSNLRTHANRQRDEEKRAKEALEARIAQLEKTLANNTSSAPTNLEDARAWMKRYPELASIMKTLMREEADFVKEEMTPRLTELDSIRKELEWNKAYATMVKAHPDFEELTESVEFQAWIDRQPVEKGKMGEIIFDALRSTDHIDLDTAIRAVNIYKQEREFNKIPKRNHAKEAAAAVGRTSSSAPNTSGGKRSFSESEIESMSAREYEKLENEIDAAKREGRIIYDITGAAR